MKKTVSVLLAFALLLNGCSKSSNPVAGRSQPQTQGTTETLGQVADKLDNGTSTPSTFATYGKEHTDKIITEYNKNKSIFSDWKLQHYITAGVIFVSSVIVVGGLVAWFTSKYVTKDIDIKDIKGFKEEIMDTVSASEQETKERLREQDESLKFYLYQHSLKGTEERLREQDERLETHGTALVEYDEKFKAQDAKIEALAKRTEEQGKKLEEYEERLGKKEKGGE